MPLTLNKPLSYNDEAAEPFLRNLQGNILKGHGRGHTVHLFLTFEAKHRAEVRAWLRQLPVTSAWQQLEAARKFRETGESGELFVACFLSAAGYQALEVPIALWPGKAGDAFRAGLKQRQSELHDPAVSKWEAHYQQLIHAMLLLAGDSASVLTRALADLTELMPPGVTCLEVERGKARRNANGDHIEHFGYVDGRSQPLLLVEDIQREKQRKDGTSIWDPTAPLSLALVAEPGAKNGSYGSFFVFRKLEQNVEEFKEKEERLAEFLGLEGDDAERAGALVVGRFEDGTPVVMQQSEGSHSPVPNNFNYQDDAQGAKCPFHAHIRRVNPRRDRAAERKQMIVRRGIPYGERLIDSRTNEFLDRPTGGVGLLFMCYQSSIENQFEHMQKLANDAQGKGALGIDPVIGQGHGAAPQWPTEWGGEEKKSFAFESFVTMKGGEYFFAPSLSFLTNL